MTTSLLSASFTRTDAAYKVVNNHAIEASIWIPKGAKPGPHPVVIRWHGGSLIHGGRNYEPWWPAWTIALAARHAAIVVTPDYRMLPECSGLDILDDMRDLYAWVRGSLDGHLGAVVGDGAGVTADLRRVLVMGESAGGYMSTQTALLFADAEAGFPRAVVASFPMLDLRDPYYAQRRPAEDASMEDFVDRYIAAIKPGAVVTERIPEDGVEDLDISDMLYQTSRFAEILGDEDILYPLENLDLVKKEGKRLPPLWMYHGTSDLLIPVKGTEAFEKKAADLGLAGETWDLKVTYVEGEDHGFDGEATLETGWVKEGTEWLNKYWP